MSSLALSCNTPGIGKLNIMPNIAAYLFSNRKYSLEPKTNVDKRMNVVTFPSPFDLNSKFEFRYSHRVSGIYFLNISSNLENDIWYLRHHVSLDDKKNLAYALKLSQSDGLKSVIGLILFFIICKAITFLKSKAGFKVKDVAQFLFESELVDRSQIGDMLGTEFDN